MSNTPAKNDVTGDSLISKVTTENYATGWDLIWGKTDKPKEEDKENVTTVEIH